MSLFVMPQGKKMIGIGVSYISEAVPDDLVNDFVASIAAPGLSLAVEREEKFPIQAGLEWLAPTALIVFIAKPYFESFLSEMGKDHYNLLKKALKKAANRLLGRSVPKIRVIQTTGKSQEPDKYSHAFSLYVDIGKQLNLKLLFPPVLSEEEVDEVVDAYTAFIDALHSRTINEKLLRKLKQGRVVSRTMLIVYDFKRRTINTVDPIPKKHR